MTSLRFVGSSLRRRGWLACAVVLAGLAITAAVFVLAPPPHQASTSILIANDPNADPIVQMEGNVTLAETPKVASDAVKLLGLHARSSVFMHTYTVASATDRLLVFTTNASSDTEAVREARALATVFLEFRAQELRIHQRIDIHALTNEIADQNEKLTFLNNLYNSASSRDKNDLLKALSRQSVAVGALVFKRNNYPVTTTSMIKGTTVLDPAAPIPPSRKHLAAIYGAA
ncbi:MAG TPA: hypothetical protein VF506_09760, partial [Streptosporangiaceae bacterium]